MLSIVLYGRNDSYGYNLHKRAALGLNCMAEILSDRDDEIVFVDYNTPDDYPTFPEAIADTLTAKAVARLRILRARPAIHDRVRTRTHLQAIEPIARNIGVRRSSPQNRWILSTNTDMIFVPREPWVSLSAIVSDLAPGFYHLPRFELPESLWEGLDRGDPTGVIEQVRRLGRTMFLNEIVYGSKYIKYDGPGDFQLIARDDLFRIHGFNEEMLLGWHVDSNIARRLHLLYGSVSDVVDRLFGYHCDHTRQVTAAHRHNAESNDAGVFVDRVADPTLPAQAESWGCAGDDIEEIALRQSAHHVYMRGLCSVITGEWAEPATARYTFDSFDETTYDVRHVLPFLADLFVSAPRRWTLGWIGGRPDSFAMFSDVWQRFGFCGGILIDKWSSPLLVPGEALPGVRIADAAAIDASADVLVFDFGAPSESPNPLEGSVDPARLDREVETLARHSFMTLVAAERVRLGAGVAPRRFICVNAVHNRYEAMIKEDIGFAATPFATRVRHGFVSPRSSAPPIVLWEDEKEEAKIPSNLLDRMYVSDGGRRVSAGVLAPFGRRGYVVHGPYDVLPPGDYRAEFFIQAHSPFSLAAVVRPIIVEVVAGADVLAEARVRFLLGARPALTFSVAEDRPENEGAIEFRIFRGRFVDFIVTGVRLIRLASPAAAVPASAMPQPEARPSNPLLEALGLTSGEPRVTA